ncbi:MAG: hypothetical protein AAGD18_05365 [Actinomycetota bacterium]
MIAGAAAFTQLRPTAGTSVETSDGRTLSVGVETQNEMTAPSTTAPAPEAPTPVDTAAPTATAAPMDTAPTTTAPPTTAAVTTTTPQTTAAPTTTLPPREVDPIERVIVTIHGDERVVDAERELRLALAPAAVEIDGETGRGLLASAPAIAAQARSGLVDVVVLAIGAHDGDNPEGYESLVGGTLDALDQVGCVVWVTAEEVDVGLAGVNEAIRRQAERFEHVVVADWAEVAAQEDASALVAQRRERFGLLIGGAVRQCILG